MGKDLFSAATEVMEVLMLQYGNSEMELDWKLKRVFRPGSGTVRVTELGWQGHLNPSPSIKEEEEEQLVDEYLSPDKLKILTGLDDLQQVRALEMRIDTRENSLGNFGTYLPNLKKLKLNNSVLTSVRDLGTALSHLQVLWMARCGLPDLDGISSCCSLKELYIAYNNIADLSQVSLLEHLEILDLEGNNIEDLSQIQYLGLCTKLSTLTVEGNLICLKPSPQSLEIPDYNYRVEIKKLIPHLKCLDEIPADQMAIPFPCRMNKQWFLVKESIKEGCLLEQVSESDSRSVTESPYSSVSPAVTQFSSASRPQTPQRPPSAHLLSGCSTLLEPTIYEEGLLEDDSSDLTHGISRVICGNPIKALHARKQKLGFVVTKLFQPLCPSSEHTYDSGDTDSINGEDLFAKLEALKKHHHQHLQVLQREKFPQVLKITNIEEEEEEEEQDCSLNDSSDEDQKGTIQNIMEITSSNSFCQSHLSRSSSDSSYVLENALPAIIKYTHTPSPPKSPSPASIQSVAGGLVRARHLKIPSSKKAALLKPSSPSLVNRDAVHHVVEKIALLNLHRGTDTSCNVVGQRHRTCSSGSSRPTSGPVEMGTNYRTILDRNHHNKINMHQPVVHSCPINPRRFSVLNVGHPLTAKAALQRLPNKPDISVTTQSKTHKL
ncbi:LOW QUALITY PROTEIN: leucine-rich repeat-containing protein 56 [Sceloporus undulatus]|uniref:LOW QUALITY PROTEIN: leucine-rich repeat-containing protein 56 n=1 Tax=Sceloporus undulatus TaxID=8520 RepID=UPI001C4C31A3|nr:LOW QUALITY PROTEIN: leucine-rich repeat-containing protein 56 [Sceloporus undulatus]